MFFCRPFTQLEQVSLVLMQLTYFLESILAYYCYYYLLENRDADYIFSTLMEFERACLSVAPPGDIPKAQAAFLGTVVSKFTPEAFHTLRRYLGTTADAKAVTSLLVRAQKFNDAGAAMSQRALREHDPREKQGVLAVRLHGMC